MLSICGFATTTNFQGSFGFTVKCNNASLPDVKVTKDFSYPFRYESTFIIVCYVFTNVFVHRLDHEQAEIAACGANYVFPFFGDYASDSQFYVVSGVLAMLYSIGSLVFYCTNENTYKTDKRIPLVVMQTLLSLFEKCFQG